MKQLLFVIVIAGIILPMTGTVMAQKASANLLTGIAICSASDANMLPEEDINPKAKQLFEKQFKKAQNVSWLQLKDGQLAAFKENDIRYSVYFYNDGNKAGLIKGYNADKLDAAVKRIVNYDYPGYTITYVNQLKVTASGDIDVYEINLAGANDIKVIQVCDEETAVVFDSSKPKMIERF